MDAYATRAQEIMRQAERESWDAMHNMTAVDTPETLAAARTLAVNSGFTDALGHAGVTIPDEFLDDLTCHIMSGACVASHCARAYFVVLFVSRRANTSTDTS